MIDSKFICDYCGSSFPVFDPHRIEKNYLIPVEERVKDGETHHPCYLSYCHRCEGKIKAFKESLRNSN